MSSTTTGTRAVRLPNDLIEYIDQDTENPLREVLESLYGLVRTGKVELIDGEVKIPGNMQFSRNISNDIIADFEVILNIYDTNFEDFFKKLYEKVRDGEIDVDEIVK